jgi:hypothetical protein
MTIQEKNKNLVEVNQMIKDLNFKINMMIMYGQEETQEFELFNQQRKHLKQIKNYLESNLVEQN